MAYLATILMAVAYFSVVLLMSLFLQAVRGMGPFDTGVRVIPLAVGMMAASPVAGRLSRRYSARVLSTTGLAIAAVAILVLALTIDDTVDDVVIGLALLAIGLGTGTFMTPNTSAIMGSVPPHRRGIANGVRSMVQITGFVASTAMSLAIVTTRLGPEEKKAAYAGTLVYLPSGDVPNFVLGYRTALMVRGLLCVARHCGLVAARTSSSQNSIGSSLRPRLVAESVRQVGFPASRGLRVLLASSRRAMRPWSLARRAPRQ
jgi:MFS family permease